ncbi:Kanadaptin [Geodia barretti]|nr:Kanadaptin [Geodia barretti]
MASFKAPSIIPSHKKAPVLAASSQNVKSQEGSSTCEGADKPVVEAVETVEQQPATGGTVPVEDKHTVTEGNGEGGVEGEGVAGEEKGGREGGEDETQGTSEDCSSGDHAGDDVNQGVMTGVGSSNGDQKKDPKGTGTRVVTSGPPPPTPDLPYTEPHWSGPPSQRYSLTVIKSGSLLEEIDLSHKPFLVFGRLPVCDVPLEHPSISRYHAVLQYRPTGATTVGDQDEGGEGRPLSFGTPNEAGYYVYDLGSTHGSFLNKSKLQPRVYYRVRVGQMVRFGGSSRLFVLEVGGDVGVEGQEMVEAEAEAEIQELRRQKEEMEARQRRREEERERLAREREEMGATWGMVMDEIDRRENEEEEVTFDPEREAYYKDDPKKALKKYFDREGLELEYEVEEEGSGRDKTYIARVT